MRIDLDELLIEAPTKQPGLRWPIPIDARLDELVTVANHAGAGTTRQELAAAIVLTAPTSPETLRDAVLKLRTVAVKKAAIRKASPDYALRKRGRPVRSRSAATR